MLSQLEGGEEQWVPDPQDLEGRDILKVTYTGEDLEVFLPCPLYFVAKQKVQSSFFFPQKQGWGAEGVEGRL